MLIPHICGGFSFLYIFHNPPPINLVQHFSQKVLDKYIYIYIIKVKQYFANS